MRWISRTLLLPVLVLATAAMAVSVAPAGAEPLHHPTVGTYSFTVHWTDPVINNTQTATFSTGGGVSFADGAIGNWSTHRKHIRIFVASATYLGKKTATGFKGTMSNTDGNTGTWSAQFES